MGDGDGLPCARIGPRFADTGDVDELFELLLDATVLDWLVGLLGGGVPHGDPFEAGPDVAQLQRTIAHENARRKVPPSWRAWSASAAAGACHSPTSGAAMHGWRGGSRPRTPGGRALTGRARPRSPASWIASAPWPPATGTWPRST